MSFQDKKPGYEKVGNEETLYEKNLRIDVTLADTASNDLGIL